MQEEKGDNSVPAGSAASTPDGSQPGTRAADPRSMVEVRYKGMLEERESNPDKITHDGAGLDSIDPNLVVLDKDKRENPRDWLQTKKWTVTIIVGSYCFLAPFTSTIFAPSLPSVMKDIGETNPTRGALQISIFMFAFGTAPLILAPLSEVFGRRWVLSCGNAAFIAFSLGAGFCNNTAQLSVCRFLSGVGSSSSLAVFGGVLADVWGLKERATASAIIGTAVMLGPVLGPVCGGWMSERLSWRWTCWVPAICAVVLEVIASFLLHETYIPTLLKWKVARAENRDAGREWYSVLDLCREGSKSFVAGLVVAASRPITYLALDPALLLLSVYFSCVFGVLYLVIVTFVSVFGEGYGHSPGIVGTDLLSQGIGAMVGMLATARLLNIIYSKQAKKDRRDYKAESRLIAGFPGALLVSIGLFVYGFTALKTHFIVPLIGVAIFSIGVTNLYLAIQLYIIDTSHFPASAISALSTLRCLFAGAFPLFGQRLFDSLGIDWGIGFLAFLMLAVGIPFPLMYIYGPRLREIGKKRMPNSGYGATVY